MGLSNAALHSSQAPPITNPFSNLDGVVGAPLEADGNLAMLAQFASATSQLLPWDSSSNPLDDPGFQGTMKIQASQEDDLLDPTAQGQLAHSYFNESDGYKNSAPHQSVEIPHPALGLQVRQQTPGQGTLLQANTALTSTSLRIDGSSIMKIQNNPEQHTNKSSEPVEPRQPKPELSKGRDPRSNSQSMKSVSEHLIGAIGLSSKLEQLPPDLQWTA